MRHLFVAVPLDPRRLLLILILACPAIALAQACSDSDGPTAPSAPVGVVLARLDCTSSFPECGWSYRGNEHFYSLARAGNGARFTLTPGSSTDLAQFYTGWSTDLMPSDAAAIYVRMHLTVHGPISGDGVGDVWTNKFVIVNDGAPSTRERAIVEMRPAAGGRLALRIQRNIDGDDARSPEADVPNDRRVALQFEIRRGSGGRVAIWIDNPNQSRPTTQSPRFDFDISRWANINVGYYQNASLAPAGRVSYTVEDVVVSDAFDPAFR
jgi:hypothetical protein